MLQSAEPTPSSAHRGPELPNYGIYILFSVDDFQVGSRAVADAGSGDKLKVFIFYSRKDPAAFADELVVGLDVAGLGPFR